MEDCERPYASLWLALMARMTMLQHTTFASSSLLSSTVTRESMIADASAHSVSACASSATVRVRHRASMSACDAYAMMPSYRSDD